MNNISVLTDFEAVTNTSNFRSIESPAGLEDYSFYIAGSFIFVSNQRNRTIRFSLANLATKDITPVIINEWIERIQKLYPTF
ncbi:MAG: hypothetical protein QM763_24105 [Agriterribacter sp.]